MCQSRRPPQSHSPKVGIGHPLYPSGEGWLYIASALDLGSRRLLGHSMTEHMRTEPVTDALGMAVVARGGAVAGVIAHADRGSQYTSNDYLDLCAACQLRPSVGRVATCFNAVAESFWAPPKRACLEGRVFATRGEGRRAIFRRITWYNSTKLHSSLDHITTNQVGTSVPSSAIVHRPPDGEMPM
ncbi:MAG: DDE-type integrase/transposase/recombinase [Ilumatobacteraceae bacterium]